MKCPKCDHEFELNDALLADVEERLADFIAAFNKHTNATGTGPSGPPMPKKEK